jgi:hypothetical protein
MMLGWLTTKKRKVHQRAMNKIVRNLNKSIEQDSLWLGRFYARQIAAEFVEYEDGSGAELYVRFRFVDRKTSVTYDTTWYSVNHLRYCSMLFWEMNDFIIHKVKVWENEKPYGEATLDCNTIQN